MDLLSRLIDEQEMSVTDISLVGVIEQFFVYLDELEERHAHLADSARHAEELADFLVVAAKLVYLKSRELLPYLLPKEEEDEMSLAEQLKMYKRYVAAGERIRELWDRGGVAYGRTEPRRPSEDFCPPANAVAGNIHASMRALIQRLKPLNALPRAVIDRSISLKNRIVNFYNLLKSGRRLSFIELLGDTRNRTDVIVSFLALLELTKQRKVVFEQAGSFTEILIVKS